MSTKQYLNKEGTNRCGAEKFICLIGLETINLVTRKLLLIVVGQRKKEEKGNPRSKRFLIIKQWPLEYHPPPLGLALALARTHLLMGRHIISFLTYLILLAAISLANEI